MQVIGVQKIDFTDRTTKESVYGIKLYFQYRMEGVDGYACDSKFFSRTSPFYRDVCFVLPGYDVDLVYSPKGQLIDFRYFAPSVEEGKESSVKK